MLVQPAPKGGDHAVHVARGEDRLGEEAAQNLGAGEEDDELRYLVVGEARKRLEDAVLCRGVARFDLGEEGAHAFRAGHVALAVQRVAGKSRAHVILDEVEPRLHHGGVVHAAWAAVFFGGDKGRATLLSGQPDVAHDAGEALHDLLHVDLALFLQFTRDNGPGLGAVGVFRLGVGVVNSERFFLQAEVLQKRGGAVEYGLHAHDLFSVFRLSEIRRCASGRGR